MLFAIGSRFGGHALYVKDNRLHYVNSFVGSVEQKIVGSEDVPTGDEPDPVGLVREGRRGARPASRPARCRSTTATRRSARAAIKTQLGAFAIAGDGLCVGRDSRRAVTDDYPGEPPYAFTGGTIDRVAVDVSGEPYVDLEREAEMLLRSQ